MTPIRTLFILFMGTVLCSCLFNDRWYGEAKLETFEASDGAYFPKFIKGYFDKSVQFENDFQTVGMAKQGVQVIQIRPLTESQSKSNETNLSWSADGVYLSYEIEKNNQRYIQLKDLSGNYTKHLAVLPKSQSPFFGHYLSKELTSVNSGLSWSKDSTRFAFMSNGGVGDYNIYIGAIGVQEKPVADAPTKDGFAVWSHKSDEIAFVSARSGHGDIYVLNTQTKELSRITFSNSVDIFPEWSPVEDILVFSSGNAARNNLYRAKRKGSTWSKPEPLTSWPHNDLRPKISPDGRYLAFYSDSETASGERIWNIHVVKSNYDGTYSARDLMNTVVAQNVVLDLNTGPSWSPDSKKIFYVKNDSKLMNPICAYDIFRGARYRLITNTQMNRDILISKLGVLSFRAQVGVWDKVFTALTNQGIQIQGLYAHDAQIHYL